jgi:hypothetical protein
MSDWVCPVCLSPFGGMCHATYKLGVHLYEDVLESVKDLDVNFCD